MPDARGARGRARRTGLAALLLGVGLLALAVPITGAALSRLPGDAVLRDLRADKAVGVRALNRLIDSRQMAGRWREDPRDLGDLVLAYLLLAERPAGDPAHLLAAEQTVTAALRAAPADPYGWTRLALVRWQLGRPAESIRAALNAACTTGPNSTRLKAIQQALRAKFPAAPDG
ncbi:hypothetical protein [Rhodovibrio salinarum]|uniref:hypothetical protein n=1 Tax=Rhodovibrio salinarum TaxID=1087 RepID=UPI0012DC1431|nr:hypothetical protein [Rhodovibrio salinarum]